VTPVDNNITPEYNRYVTPVYNKIPYNAAGVSQLWPFLYSPYSCFRHH